MADDPTNFVITGVWEDRVTPGMRNTARQVERESQSMNRSTAALVSDEAGRKMSGFNEKTEKMRQLVMLTGNQMGTAAGQATYYAGTLTYVLGRFSLLEIGVLAAAAAVGIVGYAIMKADEETKKWLERTKDLNKATRELEKGTRDLKKQLEDEADSMDDVSKKVMEANEVYLARKAAVESYMYDIERKRKETIGIDDELRSMYQRLAQLRQEENQARVQYEQRRAAQEKYYESKMNRQLAEERLREEEQKQRDQDLEREKRREEARREREATWSEYSRTAMDDVVNWYHEVEGLDERYDKQAEDAYARAQESMTSIYEANIDRREKISRGLMQVELEQERMMRQTVMNSISMFGALADVVGKDSKAASAIRIMAIVAEAAVRMQQEIAEGWAAMGRQEYWRAAMHFTSAGLFGAIAGGKIAGQARSGARGAGVGARSRLQEGRGSTGEQAPAKTETTIVVQLGGKEVGRAIYDSLEGHRQRIGAGAATNRGGV